LSAFNITKAPSEFAIPEDSFESFLSQEDRDKCNEVLAEKQSEGEVSALYILPSAFEELNSHVNWKARTKKNSSEQGGILVGCVYKDRTSQLVCGVVRHIIPSTISGNATYIQFTHNDWISMYKEFEEKYSPSEGEHPLRIIGWYHTHPNMPVNMSDIDKQTHISFFPNLYQFSVIINPQRGKWSVFNGAECKNCNGTLYFDKNTVPVEDDISVSTSDVTGTIDSVSNSFVIKRLPNPASSNNNVPPRVSVSSNYNNPHQYTNQRNLYIGNNNCYRGSSYNRGCKAYHLPYHETNARDKYVITDEFVNEMRKVLDTWNFSNDEAVSLFYNTRYSSTLFYDEQTGAGYRSLFYDNSLYAQGFICEKSQNEFLAFHRASSFPGALLVVLFSERLPDFRTICKKYSDYNCLLWFNAKDTREFLFFCIAKQFPKNQGNSNFNIKSHQKNENSDISSPENNISSSYIKYGRRIYERIQNMVLSVNDIILTERKESRISSKLLQPIFEDIKRYGKFTEPFSIAVGYHTLVEVSRGFMSPQAGKFNDLWFILNNRVAIFKCLDGETAMQKGRSSLAKFAFVISNYDVDVEIIKRKLFGYTTAFFFNIETQEHRFCELS